LKRLALSMLSAALLTGCIEGQFFYPDQRVYSTPAQFGLQAQDLWFANEDGSRLHAWWLPAAQQPARGTVLHAHGNAANISNHLPLVAWLPGAGYNVLSFDYRGFGRSEGKPTLDGVVADARAALAAARRQPGVDAQRLIVLGQSLGGATAIRALAQDAAGVRLLIIDSAFSSYAGIARDAVRGSAWSLAAPLASAALPGRDKDPVTAIATLRMPVLVLHGELDAVIPVEHGQRLHDAAHEPRRLLRIAGGEHIDALMRPEVRQQVLLAMDTALKE